MGRVAGAGTHLLLLFYLSRGYHLGIKLVVALPQTSSGASLPDQDRLIHQFRP